MRWNPAEAAFLPLAPQPDFAACSQGEGACANTKPPINNQAPQSAGTRSRPAVNYLAECCELSHITQ